MMNIHTELRPPMRLWGHFTLDGHDLGHDLCCFYDYWSDGSVWTLAVIGSDAQSIDALEDEGTYDRAYAYAHRIFFPSVRAAS